MAAGASGPPAAYPDEKQGARYQNDCCSRQQGTLSPFSSLMHLERPDMGVRIRQKLSGLAGVDSKAPAIDQIGEPAAIEYAVADHANFAGLGGKRAIHTAIGLPNRTSQEDRQQQTEAHNRSH